MGENKKSKEELQSKQNIDPIKNTEETSKFKISDKQNIEDKKNNGKKAPLLVAAILIVAIIIGLVYYFTIYTKPNQIYKRLIAAGINSYTKQVKNANYDTTKTTLNLSAKLDTDTNDIEQDILDLINNINIGIEAQTDSDAKKMIVNLKSDYNDEKLIDLQFYTDAKEEKTYIKAENLLNKYIELEDLDSEIYSSFNEFLDNQKMTVGQKQKFKKAMKILKTELTNVVKEEYCSSQREDINVNGKTINANKNIIKMNEKQLKEELTKVFENLKSNADFINCFENESDITNSIEEIIDNLKDMDDDEDVVIEIAVYTRGVLQNIEKVSLGSYEEENEVSKIDITKTDKNIYSYVISDADNDTSYTGTVMLERKDNNEGMLKLSADIPEIGNLELNIEYKQNLNENIDEIDVSNSVNMSELTDEDSKTLQDNLEKSKLYELIKKISGSSYVNELNSGIEEDDKEDELEDQTKISTQENEIVTYDNKYKVAFKIPAGYEITYSENDNKTLEKDETTIDILTTPVNKDEYYKNSVEEDKEYYESDSDYKNVKLSDVQTMDVNGRTFYYVTLSYEYADFDEDTVYKTKYVWTEISDDNVLYLEIDEPDGVNDNELKDLLTIDIKNV